jgi:hypothetical protein
VLSEVSAEVESPEGEPLPTGGRPSRAFTRAGAGGGPVGTPDDGEEAVPPEVSEAVQAVLAELSPEQNQALASLFEAMGEATGGERQGVDAASGLSSAELRSLEQATARGAVGAIIRAIIKFLTGPGKKYWRPAVAAARKGVAAFRRWAKSLPWAIRMAIAQLSWEGVQELIDIILRHAGVAEARRSAAAAGPGPGGPNETEEAVRTVLAGLFTKAADEVQSDEEESPVDEDQPAGVESYADLEVESVGEARTEGKRMIFPPLPIGPNHPVVKAIRAVRKFYIAAVKAAKAGPRAFNRWVDGLSDFNPIKWAIKGLSNHMRAELIAWLARQNVVAGGRAAAATPGETEPAEIEQVVRKVLAEALSGAQPSPA